MDHTPANPDDYRREISSSYRFHFSQRDLYARFRENPGNQQTRTLIRLMRGRSPSSGRPTAQRNNR